MDCGTDLVQGFDEFAFAAKTFHDDVITRGAELAGDGFGCALKLALQAPAGVIANDQDNREFVADEAVELGDVEAQRAVAGDGGDGFAGVCELEGESIGEGGADRAQGAEAEPCAGLAGGEDGAAPVGEIAAVPGVENAGREGVAEGVEEGGGVERCGGVVSGEAGLPVASQGMEAVEPGGGGGPGRGTGGVGESVEGGAGVGMDGDVETAIEAELVLMEVDLDEASRRSGKRRGPPMARR